MNLFLKKKMHVLKENKRCIVNKTIHSYKHAQDCKRVVSIQLHSMLLETSICLREEDIDVSYLLTWKSFSC